MIAPSRTAPDLLPEDAPFTPVQRAWLNGFFAGLLEPAPALMPPQESSEAFPWHDPALNLGERMKLAEERPLERKLMAAMAQLDCGACGYLCKTYAEALAAGVETSLDKCVPGGGMTARKVKELLSTGNARPEAVRLELPSAPGKAVNQVQARFLKSVPLNLPGSAKDTRFVEIDIAGTGLTYQSGDSLSVQPWNDPALVEEILQHAGLSGQEEVEPPSGQRNFLREALLKECDLVRVSAAITDLVVENQPSAASRIALQEWLERSKLAEAPIGFHLTDLLERFPSVKLDPQRFINALGNLRPRLYSISSSPLLFPGQIHLTIAMVRYEQAGKARKGVASTFLGERCAPGNTLRVSIRATPHFRLPLHGLAPVIMIGPGTGIAPFRAFLQERQALGARGRNWLFFGDRRAASDFLYREEMEQFRRDGVLTRLDTAFSRDQPEKLYVQHRMRENGKELWTWLQEGACLYVCGDAKRMAADVQQALLEIASLHGGCSPEGARTWLHNLKKEGRYSKDIY